MLELLRTTKELDLIRKICRFPVDRDILHDMLSRRWDLELDLYLRSLRVKVKDHQDKIFEWHRGRKAKEFIRLAQRPIKKYLV
jgi:hypothetical protein